MVREEHWESVYGSKRPEEVTWYQPHLERSLALIASCGLPRTARIVDVGGGASTLVDDLLEQGYRNLTVMDLASSALEQSKRRLGATSKAIEWIVADATTPVLAAQSVDLWHDRAVFHFLTTDSGRDAYIEQLARCVRPGGYVLISTFAPDGPERCSGLPVMRYDADGIARTLGHLFEKIDEAAELHETPRGGTQSFVYCLCRRR